MLELAKSGATVVPEFFMHLEAFAARVAEHYPHLAAELRLIYCGSHGHTRHGVRMLPWSRVQDVDWS